MVTPDKIRLTGLLRKKPWQRGFFYGPIRRRLVRLTPRADGGPARSPDVASRLCRLRAAPHAEGHGSCSLVSLSLSSRLSAWRF